jgi:hypothetical protein
MFAVRVRADAVARLSHEHDDARWVAAEEALGLVVWPSYAATIRRILATLMDPDAAPWFELTLEGRRLAR